MKDKELRIELAKWVIHRMRPLLKTKFEDMDELNQQDALEDADAILAIVRKCEKCGNPSSEMHAQLPQRPRVERLHQGRHFRIPPLKAVNRLPVGNMPAHPQRLPKRGIVGDRGNEAPGRPVRFPHDDEGGGHLGSSERSWCLPVRQEGHHAGGHDKGVLGEQN